MENCGLCNGATNQNKWIVCSGSCTRKFHPSCAGMNKGHFASWSAQVGLLWFCQSCRLTFEPAVYDRDKIIMRALRELLIRMDSMDTRLGNYGENLRKINGVLFERKTRTTLDQSAFHKTIDRLTLDDSVDPLDRSRSCDETSFFEVLDILTAPPISHRKNSSLETNEYKSYPNTLTAVQGMLRNSQVQSPGLPLDHAQFLQPIIPTNDLT